MGLIQKLIDRATMEITKVVPTLADATVEELSNEIKHINRAAKLAEKENTLFIERETTMTNLQLVIQDALDIAKLATEALGDGYQITDLAKLLDIFTKVIDISSHFKGVEAELANATAYDILTTTEGVIHSIRMMLPQPIVPQTGV